MKDKLLALLQKLKGKIPLEKFRALPARLFKKIGLPILFLLIASLGAAGALAYWVKLQPLDPLRLMIAEKIRNDFGAEQVELKSIQWAPNLKSFRLGVAIEGIEIKNLGHLHDIKAPRVELSVKFLKILKGSLPLDMTLSQATLVWGPSQSKSDAPIATKAVGDTQNRVLNFVLGRLSGLSLDFANLNIEMVPATFSQSSEDAYFLFEKVSGHLNMGLLRGPYDLTLKGESNVSVQKKLRVQGPFELTSRGVSQSTDGKTVGFKVEALSIDLSPLDVRALGFVSKPAGKQLAFETVGEVFFTPGGTFEALEFRTGTLNYAPLEIGFSGFIGLGGKSISLQWGYGPSVVERLELPIQSFESVSMNGNFETSGQLKWKVPNPIELFWKVNFNNFSIDLEKLQGPVDPDSKGSVQLSFVSEGSLTEGHIRSPRTELQIQGTEAQIVLARRNFVKPAGDPFSLIAKISCELDDYSLDLFSLNANNMQFEAKGNLLTRSPQKIKMDFRTNTIDLSRWSSYVPWFRKIPLQGSIETNGSFEGPVNLSTGDYNQVRWRLDRLNIARARGAFDRESFLAMGYQPQDLSMNGPFSFDFNFQGRGIGPRVSRAQVQAAFDFTDVGLILRSRFKKSPGVNLSASIQADQFDNRLRLKVGRARFNDLSVDFSGGVLQGSQMMSIPLRTSKPVDLAAWREFFVNLDPRVPLAGVLSFDGRLQFPKAASMEEALDWNKFGFTGLLDLKSIAGVWPPFQNTLKNVSGQIRVSSDGLQSGPLTAQFGGSNVQIKFDAKPLDSSASNRLALLWGWGGPWQVNTQVSARSLRSNDFQVTANPSAPSFGDWLRRSLEPERLSKSKYFFDVSADEFLVEKDFPAKKFVGRFEVSQDAIKLEPLQLTVGTAGSIAGSVLLDTRETVARKDPPQLVVGLKLRDVPSSFVASRALWPSWSDAQVSGELNLSSKGFDVSELRDGLKGRFFGRVFGLKDSAFAQQGVAQVSALFKDVLGASFLATESDFSKCFSDLSNAEVDLQLSKQSTEVASLDWVFKGGSKVGASGVIDSQTGAQLKGHFWPGPMCMTGGLRDCFDSARSEGSKLSLAGLPKDLRLVIEDPDLGNELIDCRMQKAKATADRRAEQSQSVVDDQAQVEKSLQGKSTSQEPN